MKKVLKSATEPTALAEFKNTFQRTPANLTWAKFKKNNSRKNAVRNQLRFDQRGLCAYCEVSLTTRNESVEHFVSCSADRSKELEWQNLLLCCLGGEREGPAPIEKDTGRTCGHSKLACTDKILNPLGIPAFPRIFRFKTETGEIFADEIECAAAKISQQLAERTIQVLNLRAGRLNRARLAIIDQLTQDLSDSDDDSKIARITIPQSGSLPPFFTTIRWFLGSTAETHLRNMGWKG